MIPVTTLSRLEEAGYTELSEWKERGVDTVSITFILEHGDFFAALWALRFCDNSDKFSTELTQQLSTHILDTLDDIERKTQFIDAIDTVCKYWLNEAEIDEVKTQEKIIELIEDENLYDIKCFILGLLRTPTPQEAALWIFSETSRINPEELVWQENCFRQMILHELLEGEPRRFKSKKVEIPVFDEYNNIVCTLDRPWYWDDPGLWNRFDVVPLDNDKYALVRGNIADLVSEDTAFKEIVKRWTYKEVDNHPVIKYTKLKDKYLEKISENVQITRHEDGTVSWGGKEEEVPFECAKYIFKKLMGGNEKNEEDRGKN